MPPPSSPALAPEADEEPALDARRRTLRAAEKIREDVARAAEALGSAGAESDAPPGAALAGDGGGAGRRRVRGGPLDAAVDGLGRVLTDLGEVASGVEALLADLGGDPGELERVEERLFAIRGVARKHQVAPEALPALAAELAARLAAIDDGEAGIARLEAALAAAEAAYDGAAGRLTAARVGAAGRLDALMAARAAAAQARPRPLRHRGRRRATPAPRAATGCASPWRRTRGCRRGRSTASPRGASSRAFSSRSRSA